MGADVAQFGRTWLTRGYPVTMRRPAQARTASARPVATAVASAADVAQLLDPVERRIGAVVAVIRQRHDMGDAAGEVMGESVGCAVVDRPRQILR